MAQHYCCTCTACYPPANQLLRSASCCMLSAAPGPPQNPSPAPAPARLSFLQVYLPCKLMARALQGRNARQLLQGYRPPKRTSMSACGMHARRGQQRPCTILHDPAATASPHLHTSTYIYISPTVQGKPAAAQPASKHFSHCPRQQHPAMRRCHA